MVKIFSLETGALFIELTSQFRPPPDPRPPPPPLWGTTIREIREEQHISQRQLASMARINRNALRRFEKNIDDAPSFTLIERVAEVLGYCFDLHLRQMELPG